MTCDIIERHNIPQIRPVKGPDALVLNQSALV
jgi:hypothetical protein